MAKMFIERAKNREIVHLSIVTRLEELGRAAKVNDIAGALHVFRAIIRCNEPCFAVLTLLIHSSLI